MNNEIKLEYELHEKDQTAGGFYRYRFGETQFWFTQNPDGEIFGVSISNEKYPDTEFYSDDTVNQYYPNRIRFHMPHAEISSYKDEDRFNRKFQYCCNVRSTLQTFFEISSHARLYWENHKDKENK